MKHSESIKAIAEALSKAQGQMKGALKDSTNPFFKSKYADLASVVAAIKQPFSDNGLSFAQFPCTNDQQEVGVETMLMHTSGEWLRGDPYFVPVTKEDAQGFGSAITYCRRYGLQAVAGIAPEDDDGNAAFQAQPKASPAKVSAPAPQAAVGEVVWGGEYLIKREEKPYKSKDGTHKVAWAYVTASGKKCGTKNPEVDAIVTEFLADADEPNGSMLDLYIRPHLNGTSFELMNLQLTEIIP